MIKKTLRVIPILVLMLIYSSFVNDKEKSYAQSNHNVEKVLPPFLENSSHWADSVFKTLTPEERITQLFMVAAYSNRGKKHVSELKATIKKHKVGGLIFFQGGPVRQAQQTNIYQSVSEVPLMIAIDGEWGLGMRLDSTISYPRQMMLGAIQDESLLYEMGEEIARQCKIIGVHINFAPVIDINNNAKNPVINSRSFGENRRNVTRKGFAYMLGMQDHNILATAKHFPGHGDTDTDSHKTLPKINHNRERLDSLELYPFRQLIDNGLGAVMVAHLNIPAYDNTKNKASSLSKPIVTDLLKNNLGFKGLIFTDALNMGGISNYNQAGEVDAKALVAGNDIILMSGDIPKGITAIKRAIKKGEITQKEIDVRCKKVLAAKRWMGLNKYKPSEIKKLKEELNSEDAKYIKRKLVEASITLLKNENHIIPFKNLDKNKIASISIGDGKMTTFQTTLSLYDDVKHFQIHKNSTAAQFKEIEKKLANFDIIIVGIHKTRRYPTRFGITKETLHFVDRLSKKKKIVLDIFANPYSLSLFKNLKKTQAIVMSYEDSPESNDLSAQMLYGGIPSQGKLPVSTIKDFPINSGIIGNKAVRLKYSTPKELDINIQKLGIVDSIALKGIKEKAYPGCQILAAKNGVVFYYKAFGYHTYNKRVPVSIYDIYDLASVTKVTATLPSIMKLYDEKKFKLNDKLSSIIPEMQKTNKKNLIFKDVLTHQSRLLSWIPFYIKTIKRNRKTRTVALNSKIYHKRKSKNYSNEVADHLYIMNSYKDSIYKKIYNSKLYTNKKYKYSDLGFYLLQKVVENTTKTSLDKYVEQKFYNSIGATTLCFNPLKKFDKEQIVPTEDDKKFRKQLLQGHVHDYGSAMMGGVAGHAGLFGNSNDLAKMIQMYLQEGKYGGKKYFASGTLRKFTNAPFRKTKNRRALGFDKPRIGSKGGSVFKGISERSFGHTGFTGITAWADPETGIIYIFMSNRINPVENNRKIIDLETRENIQKAIYDAFEKPLKELTSQL